MREIAHFATVWLLSPQDLQENFIGHVSVKEEIPHYIFQIIRIGIPGSGPADFTRTHWAALISVSVALNQT